jgi:FtsP/CotA-like multicopper oxidase with cupredoxin domain
VTRAGRAAPEANEAAADTHSSRWTPRRRTRRRERKLRGLDRKGDIARFGGFKERHDGRLGETRLVNGEVEPELEIAAGQVERWRILNASSSRYVLLSIGGRSFTILGTDGA